MQVQKLIQGSQAWRQARSREGLCLASQAAAVVNEGKFTPKNQDELLRLKRGEIKIPYTKAMRHGNQFEAEAREWTENELGIIFEPTSLTREIDGLTYWASLDGATMDMDAAVEIKCPYKGKDSELWEYTARNKAPPPYYYWQMLHQYMVCPALYFFVVYDARNKDGKRALIFTVDFSDNDRTEMLKNGWKTFWQRYHSGETPAPAFVERADGGWAFAADEWRGSKAILDGAVAAEKQARENLIGLAGEESSQGAGVQVTRSYSKGSVDYKQIPELTAIDLENYRKPGRINWRITETKE